MGAKWYTEGKAILALSGQSMKLYIAGKVSPNSVFGRHDWRDGFCEQLRERTGLEITNLDPTKSSDDFDLDEANSMLIFGRDCFMIAAADVVIVNLTDDISVGGSQEMLIAKYFHKPLVGIAPKGGKFFQAEKVIQGKTYKDYRDPFVAVTCDVLVEDIEGVAEFLKKFVVEPDMAAKDITLLEQAKKYYEDLHHKDDTILHNLD